MSSSHSRGIYSSDAEWSVLLECASPAAVAPRLIELLRSVDWSRLLALAEEHGVLGHLAAQLRDLHEPSVPPQIRQSLFERQRAQAIVTLRMIAQLFRILDRFSAGGIPALVIKGPVLAVQAYGDAALRSYGDLDLLVRQRDIRHATESMTECGYQSRVPLNAIDAGKIPGQYLFFQPDSKLIIELHNDYTLRYFPRRLPLEQFFGRQIHVPLDGREVPALSAEDELVLICVHGAKHFWERLMWIADVAALVSRQSGMDWKRVMDSAREVGTQRMLHTGLLLAASLLKAPLPNEISKTVQADAAAAKLAKQVLDWLPAAGSTPLSLFERAIFRMRMRGGLISAPRYLLRLSLSPTEEDWMKDTGKDRYPFLDALRRPFRLARKYGRDGKA